MNDTHTTVQYQLRLPDYLREKIRESAEKHNRSMNSDMVARLEQSFNPPNNPINDGNVFMDFIEALLQNAPKDKTSEVLTLLVKAWREENKNPLN